MVAIPDPATFQLMPNGGHKVGAHDLRRRHAGRRALRGRPAARPPPRARAHGEHGLRHLQRRARARVLPLQGRQGHGDARRGRLLRHDDAWTLRATCATTRSTRSSRWASRSSTSTTRSARRSTRSTCSSRDALSMADHTITYRLVVKEIAKKAGYHATFMPKPIFGENGSGMHTHQSLFVGRARTRSSTPTTSGASPRSGKGFIAGQLRHAREISAVFAQWVNSYKRLVPGYEAPVYAAWSRRNRSALIRIPLYKPGNEQATRAEIRCPGPGLQPVPHLRLRSCTRASRGSRRATSCRRRWRATSTS